LNILSLLAAAVAVVLAAAAAQEVSAQGRVLALPLELTTQSPLALVEMEQLPQREALLVMILYSAPLHRLAVAAVDQTGQMPPL
jgi:hypothetical protein